MVAVFCDGVEGKLGDAKAERKIVLVSNSLTKCCT